MIKNNIQICIKIDLIINYFKIVSENLNISIILKNSHSKMRW